MSIRRSEGSFGEVDFGYFLVEAMQLNIEARQKQRQGETGKISRLFPVACCLT